MHLLELPDELPLEILSYVRYGGTFDHAHSLTYRAGTQECIETQRALSETCKQLRAICEPKLYWVLIVDPTRPPWRLACYLCSVLARQELLKYLECVYATVRPDFLELSIIPDGALSQHTNDDWRRTVWRSSAWDEPRLQMETHAGRIWDKRALEEMNWSNNMKYRPEQAMLALLLGLACRTLQDLTVGAAYHQNKRGSAEAVVGTSYCPACRTTFHNLQRLKIGTVWHETAVERVLTSVAPVFDYLERKHPKLRLLHIWGSMELQPSKTPGEVTPFEITKPRTMQMYQLGLPRSSKSLLSVPVTDRGRPNAPLRGLRLLHRKTLEFPTTSEPFPD